MDLENFKTAFPDWLARSQDHLLKGQWSLVSKDYPFLTLDDSATQYKVFNKRLKYCRIALVTGGALYLREKQEPFNVTTFEGDFSFRAIPKHIFPDDIEISHEYSSTRYARQDINVLFPIERLREMEKEELIGELSEKNYSIYDFITQADRIADELGEPLASELVADEIDVALFFPVCELGHQTMALLQQGVEKHGIATLAVATDSKAFARVAPPRALVVDCPEGAPLGQPGNAKMQLDLLSEALQHLQQSQQANGVKQSNLSWHDPFV